MDIFDGLANFAESSRLAPRWWRIPLAILGIAGGAFLGGWLMWGDGYVAVSGGILGGALLGWFAAMLAVAAMMFLIIFAIVLALGAAYAWFTGLF